jgi:tripartite ATP-independent transporter DctP family solute receptor
MLKNMLLTVKGRNDIMKKKIIAILGVNLLTVLFFTSCSTQKTDAKKIQVLNVATIQTEDHPQTLAVKKMGEIFSELTDGRYRFDIFPNSILGPQRESLEQVQYGIVEMAVIGNPNISSFVDGFLTFEMPFLFEDELHMQNFFQISDTVLPLFAKTEKYNFKLLTYFTAGTRNMYSKKPIRTLDDLKGMKIRTAESETYSKMMKHLGGTATPMSFSEVYTSIQTGIVDGAENNEASYYSSKHYEVAPYYSYTKHLIVPDYLVINTKFYNNLPDEDKAALIQAATESAEYELRLWNEDAQNSIDNAINGGAIEVTDVDVESFQEACIPLHQELAKNSEIKIIYDAVMATSLNLKDVK